MSTGLHVKQPLFMSDISHFYFPSQIFERVSDATFLDKKISASRVSHADKYMDSHDKANSSISHFSERA